MAIREITDDDIDEVCRLHVRTWRAAYAGIVPAETLDGLDPAVLAESRRTRVHPPGAVTLVAAGPDRILGFVAAGPRRDGEGGEIYALYVDPAAWRGGHGRRLFDAAAGHLRALGHTSMTLWVLEENEPARRFYERMGMRPDGAKDYFTPRGSTARLPEIRYETQL